MMRIPHYLDKRLKDGGDVVSHTPAALYSPETFFIISGDTEEDHRKFQDLIRNVPAGIPSNHVQQATSTSLIFAHFLLLAYIPHPDLTPQISTTKELAEGNRRVSNEVLSLL